MVENGPHIREGYNPDAGTYHVYNVWNQSQPVTQTVVQTVAGVTGIRCEDIEQIYDVVDPDALNAMFKSVSDEVRRDAGGVAFTLNGRNVTVYGHGEIVVTVHKPTSGGILEPSESR